MIKTSEIYLKIGIYEYNVNIMNELKSEFKKDAPALKRDK